jgi:hypothetical protein
MDERITLTWRNLWFQELRLGSQTVSMPSRLAIASRQGNRTKSEAAFRSRRRRREFRRAHYLTRQHCDLMKDKWSRDRRIAPKYVHHGL